MKKSLLLSIVLVCMIAPMLKAQTKKELKVQVAQLNAQVAQLRNNVVKLQASSRELQQKVEACRDSATVIKVANPDSLSREIQRMAQEVEALKEELYRTRLTEAEKKIPENLKQENYVVRNSQQRKQLALKHAEHYLTNCIRFRNPQRMFTEEIMVDFEINPVNKQFTGFLRKRYIPEIGRDQYGFQKIEGLYVEGDEFVNLLIRTVDKTPVNITVQYGVKRDLYNEVIGNEQDLKVIRTLYGSITQFSIETCRSQ